MGNTAYEQIQARKVRARLRMLQHAQRPSGNVSQTCRFFGVSRSLYYIWKKRFEKKGAGWPLSNPAGDRFADLKDSGGTALRGSPNQLVSSTALPRLRFTDYHSEAFAPPPL